MSLAATVDKDQRNHLFVGEEDFVCARSFCAALALSNLTCPCFMLRELFRMQLCVR